jgi:hypothetical protein
MGTARQDSPPGGFVAGWWRPTPGRLGGRPSSGRLQSSRAPRLVSPFSRATSAQSAAEKTAEARRRGEQRGKAATANSTAWDQWARRKPASRARAESRDLEPRLLFTLQTPRVPVDASFRSQMGSVEVGGQLLSAGPEQGLHGLETLRNLDGCAPRQFGRSFASPLFPRSASANRADSAPSARERRRSRAFEEEEEGLASKCELTKTCLIPWPSAGRL